jgi:hypothetical protein
MSVGMLPEKNRRTGLHCTVAVKCIIFIGRTTQGKISILRTRTVHVRFTPTLFEYQLITSTLKDNSNFIY